MDVSYNVYLVIFSALIAVLAGYITLEMAAQVRNTQDTMRDWSMSIGALSMGVGIWAMHFIAMLALDNR